MKTNWCLGLLCAATAALAAPDGIPLKTLTAFQTFRLSLVNPGYDITPRPHNSTTYRQAIKFEEPARVEPMFNTVYMR